MKDFGKVRSTLKPDEIVIDEFSVWKHTNIRPVEENIGEENEFIGYEFNMVQYGKDEYIQYIEQTANDQITDLQIALIEVYENMGV